MSPVAVADPGFSPGGGANPRGGGRVQTYDFPKNYIKIERVWTRGGHVPRAPHRSANATVFLFSFMDTSQKEEYYKLYFEQIFAEFIASHSFGFCEMLVQVKFVIGFP